MSLEQTPGALRDVAIDTAPSAGLEVVTHEDVRVGAVTPRFGRIEIQVDRGRAHGGENTDGGANATMSSAQRQGVRTNEDC
jgi:hypothetical protein